MKELEQFLLDRAMEHDSPTLLFNLAAEYLIAAKTIRPGVVILAKMVASARAGARALTWEQVEHLLTGQVREDLDRLLHGRRRAGDDPAGVADHAGGGRDGGGGEDRRSRSWCYLRGMDAHTAGSVDAADRAAPVPGHGGPPLHQPGAGAP